MKKIIAPVDFSPASRNASEYVAQFAKAFGAEIRLLHVYRDLIPVTVGPEPWSVTVSKLQTQNKAQINKEVEYLAKKYSIHVDGDIRRGFKVNSINKASKETGANLVVMSLKNDNRVKFSTSTALKMIGKTNTPVLFIPESAVFSPIKNIVLAIDFNEVTDGSCFEILFQIIKTFDASLRVLHVENRGADINAAEMQGKLELGRILGKVSWLYDKIENNDVEEGILQFIQNHPTDMLVMLARKHNNLERFFGSVIHALSFEVKLPLLILKNN